MKFKRTYEHDLPLPSYASAGAAGLDICAANSVIIHPDTHKLVKTGWSVAIPAGFELQVRPRSGLALKYGITVLNSPGTIDSDYRGEIGVILVNHSATVFTVNVGDRIAQLVLAAVPKTDVEEVEELDETLRGMGGFGSTDRIPSDGSILL